MRAIDLLLPVPGNFPLDLVISRERPGAGEDSVGGFTDGRRTRAGTGRDFRVIEHGPEASRQEAASVKRCRTHRGCGRPDCIFFDASEPCWTAVSPFKLRRRPAGLLRDSAERCLCLDSSCTECEYFED